MTEQGDKRRETMILSIMHELAVEYEEATIIYYENQRKLASKAGSHSNRYILTKEDASRGGKNNKGSRRK